MSVAQSLPEVIPLRKGKLALFLVMALGFVAICALLALAGLIDTSRGRNWGMGVVGIAGLVFFGACTAFLGSRLFSSLPGLVIDRDGVVENTSYASAGRVPWSQITDVQVFNLPNFQRSLLFRPPPPRVILISVREPQLFLDRGNWLMRWMRRGRLRLFGTPVAIADSVLRADLDDLAHRIQAAASAAR